MNTEELRSVPNYPNYLVNSFGDVYRKVKSGIIKMKPFLACGYYKIKLSQHQKRTTFGVHRLVASAYLPNPDRLPYINHKDENRLNNNLENLEWCSPSYNTNYGTANARRKYKLLCNNDSRKDKPLYELLHVDVIPLNTFMQSH